jgi:hypothetical protein
VATRKSIPMSPRAARQAERKRLFWATKDYTFVFSRYLVHSLVRDMGISLDEAETIIRSVGEAFRRRLLDGYAVCLPGCPIVLTSKRVRHSHVKTRKPTNRVYLVRVRTPAKLQKELRESLLVKGSLKTQYAKLKKTIVQQSYTAEAIKPVASRRVP